MRKYFKKSTLKNLNVLQVHEVANRAIRLVEFTDRVALVEAGAVVQLAVSKLGSNAPIHFTDNFLQ